MKNSRRTLAALGVAGVTLATTLTATPANAVSGGGCSDGYYVRACISVDSGGSVRGDGYMNVIPTGCVGVTISLHNASGTYLRGMDWSHAGHCEKGWLGMELYSYSTNQGGFYTKIQAYDKNHKYISYATSPMQY
ncbi:hypothetical protein ACQPYK_18950 [Streptosporangium sp. CA-135522]|uniref:hypothetical protein n=1 Tax=Streptosporangium sp. CA-135522 TaxID=3240072 RepID=UPI003D93D590